MRTVAVRNIPRAAPEVVARLGAAGVATLVYPDSPDDA